MEEGESSMVTITEEDIEEEIEFWLPSIVGYVAGANPPLHVLDGFVRRLWKTDVSKVGMIGHGLFIIRFQNKEMRDRAINGGFIFFDKKPFIMKPWNATENFSKKKVDTVPTWIQLKGLELKYWGQKSLFKIVQQVGNPIQVDESTRKREKLLFPRVLVEVSFDQKFPGRIDFMNELGDEMGIDVVYEWIPITCKNCSGMGHKTEECRNTIHPKKEWRPKKVETKEKQVDDDGFQLVSKGKKVVQAEGMVEKGKKKVYSKPEIQTINTFRALENEIEVVEQMKEQNVNTGGEGEPLEGHG